MSKSQPITPSASTPSAPTAVPGLHPSPAIATRSVAPHHTDVPEGVTASLGGTLYGVTPGGTRFVYSRADLIGLRNSPYARSPLAAPHNTPGSVPRPEILAQIAQAGRDLHNADDSDHDNENDSPSASGSDSEGDRDIQNHTDYENRNDGSHATRSHSAAAVAATAAAFSSHHDDDLDLDLASRANAAADRGDAMLDARAKADLDAAKLEDDDMDTASQGQHGAVFPMD
eukprot:TRINITY_DN621_c0_g1_i1.p1 TRINITY_DN621_c0_g1~~TRINITY_DN621_c0_g1_i1.p1  ORF type:complete len:229 (-),score=41.38 TRINITY_DN621_c0_g1_i1:261-947(-)